MIALRPDRYKAYAFRGMIKFRAKDYAAAISGEDKAIYFDISGFFGK